MTEKQNRKWAGLARRLYSHAAALPLAGLSGSRKTNTRREVCTKPFFDHPPQRLINRTHFDSPATRIARLVLVAMQTSA